MGMFTAPKHKYLADMISIKDDTEARVSARKLLTEFHNASTQAKRLRIAHATQLAANRAGIIAANPRVHYIERNMKRLVKNIYREAAKNMFVLYRLEGTRS